MDIIPKHLFTDFAMTIKTNLSIYHSIFVLSHRHIHTYMHTSFISTLSFQFTMKPQDLSAAGPKELP